ncbi:MAG: hypothetical protein WDZ69_02445 [Candidatus Pacearchaeota archaeon]
MVGSTEDKDYWANLALDSCVLTINPLDDSLAKLEDSLKDSESEVLCYRSLVRGFGMPELGIGVFDKETMKRGCLYTLRGEKEIQEFITRYNETGDFMGYIKEKWEEESRQ